MLDSEGAWTLRKPLFPRPVLLIALCNFMVHLAIAGRYGFHRDELYYIAGGLRFEPGYVDHPPLAPWIAGLTSEIFGVSIHALRFWPALGGAFSVVLAALICSRLGGARRGQILASLATALCPFFYFSHTVFQTNLFDQLAWSAALFVLLDGITRVGPGERVRPATWLLFGTLVGIGVFAKYTIAVLGLALVIALALARRREFTNPALYLGGAIAAAFAGPSLWWQWRHGFPFREFASNAERWVPWTSVPMQGLMIGLGTLPLVIAGVALLMRRERNLRVVGWTLIAALVVFLALMSKPYYSNGLYVLMFGAGGAALGSTRRRWPELLMATNLIALPILAPVLPLDAYAKFPDPLGELAEMVGWPQFVQQVEGAIESLSPLERNGLVIVTVNYGEISALELLADPGRLPPMISGHNSFSFWAERTLDGQRVERALILGYSQRKVEEQFERVRQIGVTDNPWGVENEEFGSPIFFAEGPRGSTAELLEFLRHFG